MSENKNDVLETIKKMLEKGLDVSKDLLVKAGDKMQDLGEKGSLKVEILKIDHQIEKKLLELGKKTFEILSAGGIRAVDKSDTDVNSLVVEIDSLYAKKEEKEILLTKAKDVGEEGGDSPENSENPGD